MLIYILMGLYGLIIGSFLNVCIYRIPAGLSIVKPRSRCSHCGSTLKAIDLVPVMSWISTKGKCRYCHASISPRYALVELLTALFTVVVFHFSSLDYVLIWKLLFTYVAIVIAFIDWDTQEIPERLNAFVLILGISYWGYDSFLNGFSWSPLIGAVVGFASLLLLLIFGAMGGGDVKYMGAVGFLLGLQNTLLALYFGFVIGGLVAMMLVITKKASRKSMIAFGPYLVFGSWLMLIFENQIMHTYSQWFLY